MTPIDFFKDICKIPHGSGNEEDIAKYIESVAKNNGLFCVRDSLNNVYVRKEATKGFENQAPILFAAHTDMVCEKIPSSSHNFLTDAIDVYEKNGKLYANGTTLGGDDGAGVAIMLALMTDNTLIAPVTEYLFTSCEETGMDGAIGFDYSTTLSEKVVNLDTGSENGVCISCASGYRYDIKIPIERTRKCGKAYKINISGLAGGHSGVQIDNGFASATKILGVLLERIYSDYPFHIADIKCDGKANVIAPSAEATVVFYGADDEKRAKDTVFEYEKQVRTSLIKDDAKKFRITYQKLNTEQNTALPDMFTLKSTSALISALILAPQGVTERFPDTKEVQASVNLGIIKTFSDSVSLTFLARSACKRSDDDMKITLSRLAHVLSAELILNSFHGCWEYKKGTPLQSAYEGAYSEIFGKMPEFFATHAGLECGTFYEKLSALGKNPDIISIGPNMYDIHTPKETLEIASVERIYEVTKVLLKKICE